MYGFAGAVAELVVIIVAALTGSKRRRRRPGRSNQRFDQRIRDIERQD